MNRIRLVIVALIVVAILVIVYSFQQAKTTGILQITSVKGYRLAVTRTGYKPAVVGKTTAKIRLSPGTYTVYASQGKTQYSKSVSISAQHSSSVTLTKAATTTPTQSQAAAKIDQGNSLIKELPYVGPASAYEVNYTYHYTGKTAIPIIIVIGPTPASQQQALQWITAQGFNTSDLTIQYQTIAIQNHNYTNGPPTQ